MKAGCTDGLYPLGGLTYARAANGVPYDGVSSLYGTIETRGANEGGSTFEFRPVAGTKHWRYKTIYDFCPQGGRNCTDARNPMGTLLMDSAGNLHGAANFGRTNQYFGAIYELKKRPDRDQWHEIAA